MLMFPIQMYLILADTVRRSATLVSDLLHQCHLNGSAGGLEPGCDISLHCVSSCVQLGCSSMKILYHKCLMWKVSLHCVSSSCVQSECSSMKVLCYKCYTWKVSLQSLHCVSSCVQSGCSSQKILYHKWHTVRSLPTVYPQVYSQVLFSQSPLPQMVHL
jgi:hypothetical protein